MIKGWRERITGTIDFIETAGVRTYGDKRQAIAGLLRARYQQGLITQSVSTAMSQGNTLSIRGHDAPSLPRDYRRALILVQSQLGGQGLQQAREAAAAIGDAALDATLGNALGVVYRLAQQPLDAAYRALLANPAIFLAANKVNLYKAPTSGTVLHGIYHSTDLNRYTIKPIDNTLDDKVFISRNICNIHVQPFSAIQGNVAAVIGHQVTNTDLVITTQLTGCAVVYERGPAGQTLMAAHIQPTGAPNSAGTGYNLVDTLRGPAHVAFANGYPLVNPRVFGSSAAVGVDNYDPGVAPSLQTFWLGVRTAANGWELHCQRHLISVPTSPVVWWRIA